MRRWWFSIHKWVGLVIGLQVLAWMVSGFFMTAVPIEQVRSEHNIKRPEPLDLRAHAAAPVPLAALQQLTGTVTRLELGEMVGAPVWRVDLDGKPAAVIDAKSGALLSPLDEASVRRIAEADFAGEGKIVSAGLISKDPPIEYRGALPVWQLVFGDDSETHLYVSGATGKVVARRSGLWRVYDFLWSLHIMDYDTRDDFNNWLVVIVSAAGLILTVTGVAILFYRFWPNWARRG